MFRIWNNSKIFAAVNKIKLKQQTLSTTAHPLSIVSPVRSLIPPGQCQFTSEFIPVPLLEKFKVSPTSTILRFGLPDSGKSLGLSTCSCILAGGKIGNGEDEEFVVRPYTPISTNEMIGSFDLLVKRYDEGKMSSFLSSLNPSTNQEVFFKHAPFNVKIQFPFEKVKFVGMIAGGTGITPMIQALHALLGEKQGDNEYNVEKVSLLYGNRIAGDILAKDMLDDWVNTYSKFSMTHVLSHEPLDSSWTEGKRGFIGKELIASFPKPSEGNSIIFVCGPPAMYTALCGPREEKGVSGVLGEMGYKNVYKF